MIEIQQAIKLVLDKAPIQTQIVTRNLLEAYNHVLAHDCIAEFAVPHFPKSAMDGYAVRSSETKTASLETPVTLRVIGEISAGDQYSDCFEKQTAIRVMTGALVPQDYDAVIKQEDTDYGEDIVQIYKEMQSLENYCSIGEDIQPGTNVIPKLTRLNSEHIGVLASLGYSQVNIIKPLRIGIISTGSELTTPNHSLGSVQTYNSSAYTLASYIQAAGATIACMEICSDDINQFEQLFQSLLPSFDILITTGGVSVGKKDIMPEALKRIGANILFRGANIKPGTPVIASYYKQKPILSLSGNPFAALVNFHLFFWPLYAKMMQNNSFLLKQKTTTLLEGSMKASKLRRFVRAFYNDEGVSIYTKHHQSSILSNTISANCLIEQPPSQHLQIGNTVSILLWPNIT